jgi:hypothetical protein
MARGDANNRWYVEAVNANMILMEKIKLLEAKK